MLGWAHQRFQALHELQCCGALAWVLVQALQQQVANGLHGDGERGGRGSGFGTAGGCPCPAGKGQVLRASESPMQPHAPFSDITHLWALVRHQRQAQLAALRPLPGHNFLSTGNQYRGARQSGQLHDFGLESRLAGCTSRVAASQPRATGRSPQPISISSHPQQHSERIDVHFLVHLPRQQELWGRLQSGAMVGGEF